MVAFGKTIALPFSFDMWAKQEKERSRQSSLSFSFFLIPILLFFLFSFINVVESRKPTDVREIENKSKK